jgi:aromatic ring hydroxylase
MGNVFVPWEDVFVHADVEKANSFFPRIGCLPRVLIHQRRSNLARQALG